MRYKNLIVVLAVMLTLICLFYLTLSIQSKVIDSRANDVARDAKGVVDYFKKQAYIDSIWNKPVFLGMSYKAIKENELNLGLDLQGGMHVTLEVSPVEILKVLAGKNALDPKFEKAIEEAKKAQLGSGDNFADLFFKFYQEQAPNTKLADVFASNSRKGLIDLNSSDDEVKRVIRQEIEGAIDRSEEIIKSRVDKFGVTQPSIQRIQGTGRIQVELPGVDNPARVRSLLQAVAQLEFLEVWDPQDYVGYLQKANDFLIAREKAQKAAAAGSENLTAPATGDTTAQKSGDDLFGSGTDTTKKEAAADTTAQKPVDSQTSPLFSLRKPGMNFLSYDIADTAKINRILVDPGVKVFFPSNLKFIWSAKPDEDKDGNPSTVIGLYAVKRGREGKARLTGEVITDARNDFDERGRPSVSMQMNVAGAKEWKKMTGANVGKPIAIVLDDQVYSAPVVQGEIPGGNSSITGNFTVEEAEDLANKLKTGKLPAPTRIVEEVVVGPSLGLEAQAQGLASIVGGLLLVVIFMIAYYSTGGIVANVALLINIFYIIGVLANLQAALTLPGIAGIVLTMGMSVDANVLIYERIREEMRNGSSLLTAIDLGYKRAFWSIFDSNVTTFLTALFLSVFGTGPVQGFAVTLMVGILCSFFTAVYISRIIVEALVAKNGDKSNISFETGFSKSLFQGVAIDFISLRRTSYIFSSVIIVIGIAVIAIKGLNLGVDFKGGRSFVVEFAHPVVPSDLKVGLQASFENKSVEVKSFGSENKVKVTTSYLVEDESETADKKVLEALVSGVQKLTGDQYEANQEAGASQGKFIIPTTAKVGSTIADDIQDSARTAVIFSLLAIFAYIAVRFWSLSFGLGALIALFHDTLILLSIFAIAGLAGFAFEFDQVIVAAVLTVIGYSINDTVVVFDRIREKLGMASESHLADKLNMAINATLSRTVMTSTTTLIVVIVLLLFGGEVLRGFSFSLLVGIIFGTYSSIFIATPIVYDIESRRKAKAEVK